MRSEQSQYGGRARVVVARISPSVDGGRHPAKAVVSDRVAVEADVYADGHDEVSATLLWKKQGDERWNETPMRRIAQDRFQGELVAAELGRYVYTVEGWIDRFETWRRDLDKRLAANQDVSVDLIVGTRLIRDAAERAGGAEGAELSRIAELLEAPVSPPEGRRPQTRPVSPPEGRRPQTRPTSLSERVAAALDEGLPAAMARWSRRRWPGRYDRELVLVVEPVLARFSTWYEMFPRSCAAEAGRHGTLRDVQRHLPRLAEMGFDVLYLPPIHPIGETNRKGRNNRHVAEPGDPGSPWAIGSAAGGHKAVHPSLGSLEDFRELTGAARALGIEVALDVALQASPDHPYVREHPEWFKKRPDGRIECAENPPKKYEDIYPFDFECDAYGSLYEELKSIFLFWVGYGCRVFRVDNPHTKPFRFWEWCIREVKAKHPDVIFLSEAFTRPNVMYELAKIGFSQSYTYFPWRNSASELRAFCEEVGTPPVSEFYRPNNWPNTPDILPQYLQYGGRNAFIIRLALAATLCPSYGIYGPAFELCENRALREGSEEYLDSEKYEVRHWNLDRPDGMGPLIARINKLRRESPALQREGCPHFHASDNDRILCYSKVSGSHGDVMLCVVNLDPHYTQQGHLHLDLAELGVTDQGRFQVHDLLTDTRFIWQGPENYVELDPRRQPAYVFRVLQTLRSEADFEYFA